MRGIFKLALLLLIPSLVLNCSDSSTIIKSDSDYPGDHRPEPDVTVPDLSEDIEIGYWQTALVESESLEIRFSSVPVDCRCPIGAECYWEGQAEAEFWLTLPASYPAVAIPIIRPGSDTDLHQYLSACALGYRVSLIALNPYPDIKKKYGDWDYAATIRIERSLGCGDDHVQFTWIDAARLQVDPVIVLSGSISGDTLTLRVKYGGGCREHNFKLFMHPVFMESYPVQANLFLQHVGHNDPCEAIIAEHVPFDIRAIAELYREAYGGYDDIILNVYGFFADTPEQRITITYSPE